LVSIEVLAVGRELLIGKTLNTNAHWMGARLARMGGMINRITTVSDSLTEISSALREILKRKPDFVIVIGGLGPTPDDMTLKGVALALDKKIKLNRDAIQMIKDHYKKVWKTETVLTPARKKMASLPEGSVPQYNPIGTAPGVRLEHHGTVIYCLPGVPKEMKAIYKSTVEKEIRKKMGRIFSETVVMDLEGIFESTLAPILRQAGVKFPRAYIKSHPKGMKEGRSRIELDIAVTHRVEEKALAEIRALEEMLAKEILQAGGTIVRRKGPA
jgi:molybdenum cofactor synthesis domain-containing protein